MTKHSKAILWSVVAVGLMVAVVPLAIWVTHTQTAQVGNARSRCERGEHQSYKVVIQDDKVAPAHTAAKLCDTLTVINLDSKDRLMAFGKHEAHISYDGISERLLGRGESFKVTLIKSGDYLFHDHDDDTIKGTFSVQP